MNTLHPGSLRTLRNGYLGVGGVLLVLYVLVPPVRGSPILISFLSGSSAVAIVVGVHRNRPASPWPWWCFALAQSLFFLGDVYTYVYPRLAGTRCRSRRSATGCTSRSTPC